MESILPLGKKRKSFLHMWVAIKRKKIRSHCCFRRGKISCWKREMCGTLTPWGVHRSKVAQRMDTAVVVGIRGAPSSWLFPLQQPGGIAVLQPLFCTVLSALLRMIKTNSRCKSLVPVPLTQYLVYRFMCQLIIYAFSSGKKAYCTSASRDF